MHAKYFSLYIFICKIYVEAAVSNKHSNTKVATLVTFTSTVTRKIEGKKEITLIIHEQV